MHHTTDPMKLNNNQGGTKGDSGISLSRADRLDIGGGCREGGGGQWEQEG